MKSQETKTEVRKRKGLFHQLMRFCGMAAVATLLLAYLAAAMPPRSIGYLALFGLAYPIAWLANMLFAVYWFWRKSRIWWLPLLVIAAGWNHMGNFSTLNFTPPASEKPWLSVLTYNMRLMGAYDRNATEVRNGILHMLSETRADVMCFQEFYYNDAGKFNTRDTLLKVLPNRYFHERYTHAINGRQYFGVAIFSKWPIVSKGAVPFESDANNMCIYADIVKDKDTVRIYNTHLSSIRFKEEDYRFIEGNENKEQIEEGGKRILRRLKKAFYKRQEQTGRLTKSLDGCPHRAVLCGDFNDTPASYCYTQLRSRLSDSFTEAGTGIGNTYNGPFPSFRIDYVLHDTSFKAVHYQTIRKKFSDHYPVLVHLEKRE